MLGAVLLNKTTQSLVPAARSANAAVNGASADLTGKERAYIVISAGVITDGTHTFKVQECDDNATWLDAAASDIEFVAGAAPQGTSTPALQAAQSSTATELAYLGIKRFVRVVATTAGATTGGVFEALIIAQGPAHKRPM